jgi:CheY-like chemotaxis protein
MIKPLNILLADDDLEDQFFFEKALTYLPIVTNLTTFRNGVELMKYLITNSNDTSRYDILFLDLSMPYKTGFECLIEIKENVKLQDLQVVMFTSSFTKGIDFEEHLISTLVRIGATSFIRKSDSFEQLKNTIEMTLNRLIDQKYGVTTK